MIENATVIMISTQDSGLLSKDRRGVRPLTSWGSGNKSEGARMRATQEETQAETSSVSFAFRSAAVHMVVLLAKAL